VNLLSGGERSRLTLAKILLRGGNLLILDEPTNDLDLSTLQILEEGLATFGGCSLIVSHDRWFLNRVCTHILAFEEGGSIDLHVGDYDYYLEKRASRLAGYAAPLAKTSVAAPKQKARKLSYKEQRELEGIEDAIHAAEAEVAAIEAQLSDPQFFVERSAEFPAFHAKAEAGKVSVANLYARWEELEAIKAAQ
jgi:ATP-binding cassette subfamily F protein uup